MLQNINCKQIFLKVVLLRVHDDSTERYHLDCQSESLHMYRAVNQGDFGDISRQNYFAAVLKMLVSNYRNVCNVSIQFASKDNNSCNKVLASPNSTQDFS